MRQMNWGGIVGGIAVGAILGIAGTLYMNGQQIARLEEQVAQVRSARVTEGPGAGGGSVVPAPPMRPEALLETVKEQQRRNVRESFGELSGQCFTDADLQKFIDAKRPAKIAEDLKTDKSFLAAVLALRNLAPPDRQRILDSAAKPLRPTWTELGRISREGQTEAGQRAEVLIAEAIVAQARALMALPEAELQRLYAQ
jgi:hypothetical protein